eukprot:scaffold9965_cov69-Cyclotella_meneghiniana.AAC.5
MVSRRGVLCAVEGSRDPVVEVEWNAMPDVAGFEDSQDEIDSNSEGENKDEGESNVEMNDEDDCNN